MKSNIIISIVIAFSMMWAGTEGTIRGNVSNMEGENLVGAQIYIEELGIGAVADPDGNYILLNVPVGTYDVTATMISYATKVYGNVAVIMDNTVWLNITLEVEALEGDVIYVSGEKALVEKGSTAKKITIGEEAIEALPIRDVSELYSLQSGVVKVEGGMRGGIPDHEEKGLEEVHVRGGRSGEIAYLIDGMYIRNPIYGGIGNGTRLNLFAVKEFDWQPGGFNAEYGDAMSAVSNYHTASGGEEFAYKFKYETSLVGAAMGNAYDELRGYNDYNLGFGGTVPLLSNLKYWVSGQYTNYDNYRVFKFDDKVYDVTDRGGINNKLNAVQPWDSVASFRGFGLDNTWDVFGKLTYKFTSKLR
ncbi:MAG: carboxypeptidase regulatory-like domain-containing protein, partial [Candidatus Marinimicrobia bacterium]|nr:carboxypeptidase regulatory-like domain-containing protein [Candidatus Neomarinimicrobiota bacterium]